MWRLEGLSQVLGSFQAGHEINLTTYMGLFHVAGRVNFRSVCNNTQNCYTVNSVHWVHSTYFWWFRFTFLCFFPFFFNSEGRSIFVDVMPAWLTVGGHCKGTRSFQLLLHIQRCDTESVFGVFLRSGTTDRLITHCAVLQPAHLIPCKSDQRRL